MNKLMTLRKPAGQNGPVSLLRIGKELLLAPGEPRRAVLPSHCYLLRPGTCGTSWLVHPAVFFLSVPSMDCEPLSLGTVGEGKIWAQRALI